MDRAEILDTAKQMVCGHREQDYGSPENNFQVIADLWNMYLVNSEIAELRKGVARVSDKPLNAFDVAIMMTLFKIGRITSGTCTDDSIVDACGYLACAGEIKGHANEEAFIKTLQNNKEPVNPAIADMEIKKTHDALDELKCFTDRRPDPEAK